MPFSPETTEKSHFWTLKLAKVATELSFRFANCSVQLEFDETLGEGRRRVGLHLLNCQDKLFRFRLFYRVGQKRNCLF